MLNILNNLTTAVWVYDIDNYRICWANEAALVLWESDNVSELYSRNLRPETSDAVQETLRAYQRLFESGKHISRFWRYSPKGVLKEAYSQMSGYRLEDGRMALLVEALTPDMVDIDQTASSIIRLSTYTLEGAFISGNPPFLEDMKAGFSNLSEAFSKYENYTEIVQAIRSNGRYEGDVLISTKCRDIWHKVTVSISDNENSTGTILLQQIDINERKLSELSLKKDVVTDPLTGLLNRRGLKQTLTDIVKPDDKYLLFYIDLDGFKLINDSLGHAVGDRVLQSVARRLTENEFSGGIACRFGGDEFIWVVASSAANRREELADSLILSINEPYFDENNQPMHLSASVGIVAYPDDGRIFSKLISRADAAMFSAKKQGKRRWVSYIRGMENTLQRNSKLAQCLFQAWNQDELRLFYQPIFNVQTNTLHSFEALLRWNSPVLGWIPAEETIRVAEEIGVIIEIEKWVIDTAIRDLVTIRKRIDGAVMMAVNVSSKHFSDPSLPAYIIAQLEKHGLPPSALILELTESTLLSDVDRDENSAQRIVASGLALSIDDFGTGYSSLAYLHRIPATIVKIDRSFTQRLEEDQTMIASIHHLIGALHFETLVEGVESKEQSQQLQKMGIYLQQGHALGMPEPLEFYLQQPKVTIGYTGPK